MSTVGGADRVILCPHALFLISPNKTGLQFPIVVYFVSNRFGSRGNSLFRYKNEHRKFKKKCILTAIKHY